MNGCTVTFEGDHDGTYNVPCNQVSDIDENTMVNTGYNGSIYLYPDQIVSGGNRSNYIALPSMGYPRFYSGSSYNYTEIMNVSNVSFNLQSQIMRNEEYIKTGLSFLLSVFVLVKIFSRN